MRSGFQTGFDNHQRKLVIRGICGNEDVVGAPIQNLSLFQRRILEALRLTRICRHFIKGEWLTRGFPLASQEGEQASCFMLLARTREVMKKGWPLGSDCYLVIISYDPGPCPCFSLTTWLNSSFVANKWHQKKKFQNPKRATTSTLRPWRSRLALFLSGCHR